MRRIIFCDGKGRTTAAPIKPKAICYHGGNFERGAWQGKAAPQRVVPHTEWAWQPATPKNTVPEGYRVGCTTARSNQHLRRRRVESRQLSAAVVSLCSCPMMSPHSLPPRACGVPWRLPKPVLQPPQGWRGEASAPTLSTPRAHRLVRGRRARWRVGHRSGITPAILLS